MKDKHMSMGLVEKHRAEFEKFCDAMREEAEKACAPEELDMAEFFAMVAIVLFVAYNERLH